MRKFLITFYLLFIPFSYAENTEQFIYSKVHYDTLVGLANFVGNRTDEVWPQYKSIFQPIYDELNGNAYNLDLDSELEIDLTSEDTNVALENNYQGAYVAPNKIYITTDSDGWSLNFDNFATFYPVLYHELWHRFQSMSGVYTSADYIQPNKWVIEGTADLAPYVFGADNQIGFDTITKYVENDGVHSQSVLDLSYSAALFLYYIWKTENNPNFLADVMTTFGIEKDSRDTAESLQLDQYWEDFTKRMWNQDPVTKIMVEGHEIPKKPDAASKLKCGQGVDFDDTFVVLPGLSWSRIDVKFNTSKEYCNIYFNELGESEDVIIHAFYEQADGQYVYKNLSEETFVRVCHKEGNICSSSDVEDYKNLSLIVANKNIRDEVDGTIGAGTLPADWILKKVTLNEVIVSKARGLSLSFGTGGGMLIKGKEWWVHFPIQLFEGESLNALTYINKNCFFKGYVKFKLTDEKAEWNEEKEREEFTWKARIVKQGAFIDTPSGWWCEIRGEVGMMGALGGLPAAGAASKIYTELNTAEYPEFSAAGKMSKIMKAIMNLNVQEGQNKEIKMYHQKGSGAKWELVVPLTDTIKAYYISVYGG